MKILRVSFKREEFKDEGFITYTENNIHEISAIDINTNEIIEDEIDPLDVTEIYPSSHFDEGNINEVRSLINKAKEEM